MSHKKHFPEAVLILKHKPYSESFIDQTCSVNMVEFWPHSFTIQPSWTHACSVTHIWFASAIFRVRSFGVIRIRINDPRSVWVMVHQRNRWIHSGYGFAVSFDTPMIQTDLGSLILIQINPKESSLILWHFLLIFSQFIWLYTRK